MLAGSGANITLLAGPEGALLVDTGIADKADDVLWVGNSWGANLARINTRTNETTYVPLPNGQQPYHVHVDRQHRPWGSRFASPFSRSDVDTRVPHPKQYPYAMVPPFPVSPRLAR